MTGKLIVVSNRIPSGDIPSGGLVVALHAALAETGGIWIGSASETGTPSETFETIGATPYQRLAFRLSPEEEENYYLGFANSVLWPLFHRRGDLVDVRAEYEADYIGVNRRLARMIAELAQPDDLLWIHDYHFLPLAHFLRELGVTCRIGFFLHIPFPNTADLGVLPNPVDFAEWIAAYSLVGLQTRADVARCLEMFRADPRAEFMTNGSVKFGKRFVSVLSFPIGIDVEDFARAADVAEPNIFGSEHPGEFIIGVDRLDYSKGLPNRFLAFERYLENRTKDRRPTLIQIAPPTREAVAAYQDIRQELEVISGHVNGRFAELDWTPIRYIHRPVDRAQIATLFRKARACLVTSMADGMNLVAKEFVAAQDPDDPGVLILSRFAGAAEDMTDALSVNPYDLDDIAQAIEIALTMDLAERQERQGACLEVVRKTDVAIWSKSFLSRLSAQPRVIPDVYRNAG